MARGRAHLLGQRLEQILGADHKLLELLTLWQSRTFFDTPISAGNETLALYDIHLIIQDNSEKLCVFMHPRPRHSAQDLTEAVGGAARLASGVAALLAHEIRNPLAAIMGAAQLLEDGANAEDQALLALIEDEAVRIGRLASNFEDIAGTAPPRIEKVNIHKLLDQSVRAAKAGFAVDIEFTEAYDPSLPEIPADVDRLQRALTNLLKNAAEAINERQSPTRAIKIRSRYQTGVRRGAELPIEITIEDTGGGIDDAIMRDIFKPFITSKNNGTGLGLSVVARSIHELGGLIEAHNTHKGARFRLLLPKWSAQWTEQ